MSPASSTADPADPPGSEFSSISLYIGPDGSVGGAVGTGGLGSAVATLSGASALNGASSRVCYSGACGAGGVNYESVNSATYYGIYAITFSGLNIALPGGVYDFAIGATDISTNTFALLGSDPADGTTLNTPNSGFLYFFADGAGGAPKETYQYASGDGLIGNYPNTDTVDSNFIVSGTASPEPSTFGLMVLGFGGLLGLRRRVRG